MGTIKPLYYFQFLNWPENDANPSTSEYFATDLEDALKQLKADTWGIDINPQGCTTGCYIGDRYIRGKMKPVLFWEEPDEMPEVDFTTEIILNIPSDRLNPEDYVISFHHEGKGMNYCYVIEDIEKISESNYETISDLSDNPDLQYKTWQTVMSREELEKAIQRGYYPFNKIKSIMPTAKDKLEELELQ